MAEAGAPVSSWPPFGRDLIELLAVAMLLYLIAFVSVESVHVVGYSMQPTLDENDLVLASRVDYRLHAPERGDIVIVRDPYDPTQNFIKRVIGLPGDHILIRAAYVYVNNIRLEEPYVSADWVSTANWPLPAAGRSDGEVVPTDSYFVLGDNRDHSSDSRLFGYISRGQIEGKALARFWPPERAELLTERPYLAKAP